MIWRNGTKVHTLYDKTKGSWATGTREDCEWDSYGIIVNKSQGHGLCYCVEHEGGETAWYDSDELELHLSEEDRILNRGW